ncbi:hypothetical protein JZU51_00490 [bacterium]|nr:hypothetical protein [bacterium]
MELQKRRTLLIPSFFTLEKPLFAFAFALIAYFIISAFGGSPFRVREYAYFNYLADAFLHGQFHLRLLPPNLHDLSFFNGQYYLYWPPIPAIILMPFIALFGVGFSDVFFNVVVAAINVAVIAALLRAVDRHNIIRIDANYRSLLVLFFALGTVHATLAPFGKLWFTAQLVGFLLVALAYLCAIEFNGATAFILTGILIACAMLTRNHLLFTGIWPAYYLLAKNWNDRPKVYLYSLLALIPSIIMGLLFLGYNYARFGNPFELGITYHHMAPLFAADYQKYGTFNIHYLPINFYYQYLHYPIPFNEQTLMGGSLFLLSPVFIFAFRGIFLERKNISAWMLIISILATSVPILLLMGTGWVQYGPRYTLDFTVPLLLLTALGVQSMPMRSLMWLVGISIIQYIPGLFLFASLQI